MKKRKKLLSGVLAGLLCLSLVGCGASNMASGGTAADGEANYKGKEFAYMADSAPGAVFDSVVSESESVGQTDAGSGAVYRNSEVKLIRRANLTVQTTEFDKAQAALDALVNGLGGYYENAELRSGSYYNQNSNRSGNYTIRIPAEKYDAFMTQVAEASAPVPNFRPAI